MPGPHVKDRRRFLSHLLTASSAIAAPWALPGLAQTVLPPESNPAKDLVFSTSVRVVNILATVRDRDGKIVRNLTKDDFTLEEAGHPQEIRYFSQQTDLPITVGLLVDLSSSVAFLVEKEKMASQAFLRNVMREQDLGFVMSFGFRVYINQEPTSSRSDLARVIGSLQPRYGGTRLYDAVTVASNELLSLRDGRKTIVVMTDGQDSGSQFSLNDAIEAAQRANAIVYIPEFGVAKGDLFNSNRNVFRRMPAETGGRHFPGGKLTAKAFAEIEEELRSQYSLGFEPQGAATGFRSINLRAKNKSLKVQARTRYYAE